MLIRWQRIFFICVEIFTFPLWVFKWTFTFEMPFIPSWTKQFKPHPHTRHLSRPTSTPSNNAACLLMFAYVEHVSSWLFGYFMPSVMSDLIQNIRKTSQVRSTLFVCLIWFFTPHQQSFSYKGTGLPGLNQYLARINVLAQGHNAVVPVRLVSATLRSRVKHSTTEPPHSLGQHWRLILDW